MALAQLRIYRILLRQARAVRATDKPLALSAPIDINRWGRSRYGGVEDDADALQPPPIIPGPLGELLAPAEAEALQQLLPREEWPLAPALTGTECAALVKRLFRSHTDAALDGGGGGVSQAAAEDLAFTGLRVANVLASQWARSSVAETEGVRIILDYRFVQRDEAGHDVYAYRLLVQNRRDHRVQLLGRHWVFEDHEGAVLEVPRWGEGVVGLQPHLRPNQWIEYVSGTTLRVSPGVMHGAMLMVDGSGKQWEAAVSHLKLIR